VASWDAVHLGLSTDSSRRWVAQTSQSLSQPSEVFVLDRATGEGSVITSFARDLAGRDRATWERFTINRGGLEVEAWMLKPPGFEDSQRYPAVLDIHGGPNMWHGHSWYQHQQLMASNGYLVIFANPRGSTSYGRDYTKRVMRDWGGEDFLDLMAVVDEVASRPYVDASRIGVRGYSYGGYMTSWILGQTDRFRAAMVGAPCFNLVSMWGTSDIGAAWDDVQWGGSPVENEAWYRERSPSTWAHRAVTPTLVVHGEADIRCPIGQGEELFTALLEAGVDAEFARYPGAAHLFPFTGQPRQREDLLGRELAWFDAHLGTS
jgi:dipeptidyl aminopeptidase/acylaminoacyl peptidase